MPLYYTRKGDKGDTRLFGIDNRVSKASLRIELIGQVDELQAFIGLARSSAQEAKDKETDKMLRQVQEHLFILSADIASPIRLKAKRIGKKQVVWLEQNIDLMARKLKPLKRFVFPTGTRLASNLHLCRAVCRRTERAAVALNTKEKINEQALAYINRLSSFFFVLARMSNRKKGILEDEWIS